MHIILAACIEELLAAVRYVGWLRYDAGSERLRSGERTTRGRVSPPAGRFVVDPAEGYDPMRSGQGAQGTRTYALPARERSPAHASPGSGGRYRRSSVTTAWDTILRQDESGPDASPRCPTDYADYRRPRLSGPDGYLRAAQSDPDWTAASGTGADVSTPAHVASDPGGLGRPIGGGTANGQVVTTDNMACCSKKNILTVMTSTCASASFAFLCIAVATDYWLHAKELKQAANGTHFYEYTYTGLWRKCSANGTTVIFRCEYVNYFASLDLDGLGPTKSILVSMRRSTIFPLISLLILLIGEMVCFVGHCNQKKKVLTFVAGILFVVGGLSTLTGIILFIGAITGEVGNKPQNTMDEPKFEYWYGSSFVLTVSSFIASELTGVLSVYLYISRHTHAYRKKQERLTIVEANERQTRTNRGRRARSHSGDNSPSHSDTYYTYTPMSDTSKEMSNYTIPREFSRHTVSTSAETHLSKEHSLHSVRDVDTYSRRTTPV